MSQPKHVAIIMDGNGRWAKARGHNRTFGHVRGAGAARRIIDAAAQKKIEYLTLFVFSTENWFRPQSEISLLMKLLVRQLKRESKNLIEKNIRFQVIGDLTPLPVETRRVVEDAIDSTKNNTGMNLVFALSYGGRQDIRLAVQKIVKMARERGIDPQQVTDELISSCLQTAFIPDPDLIIRTSGESRISNFFLWQAAYSELYITKKLWPDFSITDFEDAMQSFRFRDRRFGRVQSKVQTEAATDGLAR